MKKNRDKLRRLMGSYDINARVASELLGVTQASIRQYRSRSGQDIPDINLDYLRLKLAELEQANE